MKPDLEKVKYNERMHALLHFVWLSNPSTSGQKYGWTSVGGCHWIFSQFQWIFAVDIYKTSSRTRWGHTNGGVQVILNNLLYRYDSISRIGVWEKLTKGH